MAQSAAIAKVSPVHRQLADWLIANGGVKKGWASKAAKQFGYSGSWLSVIYHSDAFQDYYGRLASEHSAALAIGLADKVNGLAGQAIDILADRLDEQGSAMGTNEILSIAELALKRTALAEGSRQPQVQVNVVSQELLAEARANMRAVPAPLELKADKPSGEGTS